MRGHTPITIENFNGLWARGGADSVPLDHFSDCKNISFIQSGFKSRDGINTYLPYGNVRRQYTFITQNSEGLLVLDSDGNIFHTLSPTPFIPILTIVGMTDFGFQQFAGRAYISPSNGVTGLLNQKLYVYKGDGTTARLAGGDPPNTNITVGLSGNPGNIEAGVHLWSVVFETDTGFLTSLAPATEFTNVNGVEIRLTNIPISTDPSVVARRIVATISIDPATYTGNRDGYQFFFVPGLRLPDNTTTQADVSFFDQELIDDASHLKDNFARIPAGVGLNLYHNRLLNWATQADISLCYVSFPGEPEAISQVDGLIIAPLDAQPLTNAQEYRDILYLFKQTRTVAYTDNGDVPSSWPLTVIDQGIGASVHGICTVLDTGGVNIEYLIIGDYSGVMLFNGAYQRPELSWKIRDYWFNLDRSDFGRMQLINDSVSQIIYILLPLFQNNTEQHTLKANKILIGDYSNGMNPKDIRWAPWIFGLNLDSLSLINTNQLIIGASEAG